MIFVVAEHAWIQTTFKAVESQAQQLPTQKRVDAFLSSAIRKCVSTLDKRIETSAYNTRESTADPSRRMVKLISAIPSTQLDLLYARFDSLKRSIGKMQRNLATVATIPLAPGVQKLTGIDYANPRYFVNQDQ
jgi:hypothetical protein